METVDKMQANKAFQRMQSLTRLPRSRRALCAIENDQNLDNQGNWSPVNRRV